MTKTYNHVVSRTAFQLQYVKEATYCVYAMLKYKCKLDELS